MEFKLTIGLEKLISATNKKNIPILKLDKQCKESKQFNITIKNTVK